jgi:hypothetical protein
MLRRSPIASTAAPLVRVAALATHNPARRARRRKKYHAHLNSARFRALRLERFALDRYMCTCGCGLGPFPIAALRADHVHYGRVPNELIGDIRTMWVVHHDAKDGWKWQGKGPR